MEDHRVHIRLPARDRRYSLKLVEPLLVKEDGHVGEGSVVAQDRKLTSVDRADAMRDVELDLVAVGQGLDRMDDVLDELSIDDETEVLIVTGAGPAFCAGQDIRLYFRGTEADPAMVMGLAGQSCPAAGAATAIAIVAAVIPIRRVRRISAPP